MIEHRNIESIIEILNKEIRCVEESHKVNPAFIDMVVDFFKVYADKSHHGKEEDIFFKALYQKQLAEHHKNYIDGIVEEHNQGRATVKKLINATERYKNGQKDTVEPILEAMKWLADFYPKHIEKEDKNFFCPVPEIFFRRGKRSPDARLL